MNTIEIQRAGLLELADLCLNSSKKDTFKVFVENLQDYNGDPNYMTTLNFVVEYLYKNNYSFIICLDWKQEITEFTAGVSNSLSKNFGVEMALPQQADYGPSASVSFPKVFTDFDTSLKNQGFQLSFIDTDSDEYMVVVHKVEDLNKVESAVKKIGYPCLPADHRKISGL